MVKSVYQYDVTFDPDKPKKMLPEIFEKFRQIHFNNIRLAFDGGKLAFSPKELALKGPIESEIKIMDRITEKEKTYKVTFKDTNNSLINMKALAENGKDKPLRAINALDVVLRMAFQGKAVTVGRSFFLPPSPKVDLGDGYELWHGLFQSAILGDRAYLNVDVAHKGFPSEVSIIDIIKGFRYDNNPDREMSESSIRNLTERLKGLNIIYQLPSTGRSLYRFNGLKGSSRTQTFFMEDKTEMTVEKYFATKNIKLKYPLLPCVWVGNRVRNIYLPSEFCKIQEGQAVIKKLNENQTREMIKFSATSTDVRKKKILTFIKDINHNANPVIKDFGINVGSQFEEINARKLPAPSLEYKDKKQIQPRDGVWRAENTHFLQGRSLTNWAILVLDDRFPMNIIKKFAEMLSQYGRTLNMMISDKYDIDVKNTRIRDHELDEYMKKLKAKKIELLFVVIPDRPDCYPMVKQAAELRCGILTQCVKSNTLSRRLEASTVSNILLKVNSKLNGVNHKVNDASTPRIVKDTVMLIGADVTHPAPGERIPSCVGVAASHDENAFQYNICWRMQDPKKEIIVDLKNIIIEQLRYFKKMRNSLPNKLIYYRDGVSDGQFQEVLDVELRAAYAACAEAGGAIYKPSITFIVVQKRHHTRFFPGRSKPMGRNNNVFPGTIVDTDITAKNETQFFLVSHASIQGVAKPTKYCLLHDDSNMPVDDLQKLTYNLCHMFTRCNRAVSYVAPTYYAHLAAYRGRVYVTGKNVNLDQLEREYKNRLIKEEISKGHPMFFV